MQATEARRGARSLRRIGVTAVLLLLMALAVGLRLALPSLRTDETTAGLSHLLSHRGRVAVVGRAPDLRGVEGLSWVDAPEDTELGRALRASDASQSQAALERAGVTTLLLDLSVARHAPRTSVLGGLAAFRVVDGFRTIHLSPEYVLAERFEMPSLSERERDALARVARQILAGSQPPRLAQFPPSLRAPHPAEVLLMLRRPTGELALWRSARSSSLASGLLTAVGVARQRWDARTSALGGSLADELPRFTVEVALLVDDGTLGSHARGFLDQAITTEHGVAYDDPSVWRYLLPEAEERVRADSGSSAFRALFRDNQLREDAFDRDDLRLYRVRVVPLSRSPGYP